MVKIITALLFLLLAKHTYADTIYSPNYCEYSVTFPGKPTYTTVVDPNFGKRVTAKYGTIKNKKGYHVEADCTGGLDPKNTKEMKKDFLIKLITSNFKRLGVVNAQYKYSTGKLGNNVTGTGRMEIDNTMVIFKSSIFVGKHSFIMLHTGTFTSKQVRPEVIKFLNSLEYMEFLTID